jgi:hypothetical protein
VSVSEDAAAETALPFSHSRLGRVDGEG